MNDVPILWLTICIAQVVAAVLLTRSGVRAPAFRTYIYFEAIASPLSLILWQRSLYWSYFIAFYTTAVLGDILMLATAFQVYRTVFGPRAALPHPLVPETTAAWVAMAFSGATAVGVFVHAVVGGPWERIMLSIEQTFTIASWAAFSILIVYSLTLRIAWPRRAAGIATGFVLYLSIDILAVFIRARFGALVGAIAGLVGQCSYLLSIGVWCWCFWEKEPTEEHITREQTVFMKERLASSLDAMRRAGVQNRSR